MKEDWREEMYLKAFLENVSNLQNSAQWSDVEYSIEEIIETADKMTRTAFNGADESWNKYNEDGKE